MKNSVQRPTLVSRLTEVSVKSELTVYGMLQSNQLLVKKGHAVHLFFFLISCLIQRFLGILNKLR